MNVVVVIYEYIHFNVTKRWGFYNMKLMFFKNVI